MAAPREARWEGLMAVVKVDGDKIAVVLGKMEPREEAILGVWDVPPERIT